MKVLLVTAEDPGNIFGGLGTFIRDYSFELKKKVEVKILLLRLNRNSEEIKLPPPSNLVDYFIAVNRSGNYYSFETLKAEECIEITDKVFDIFKEWDPDIIHINDRQCWMPFRNFNNTVFSLHLSMPDLIGLKKLDAYWYNELQIEKDACTKAKALIVYSKFMQNVVWKKLCEFTSPLVLPLGFDSSKFHSKKPVDKIVISYFGRLTEGQKGFVEFVQAIDMIPEDIIKKYNVEFNVYGKGEFPDFLPKRYIHTIDFLEGKELSDAYAESHIVVMPSKYEPFGLVGLESLASGCLLLCPEGQGMDEYIQKDINFIPIEVDTIKIKETLSVILENLDNYIGRDTTIQKSVSNWTWERCVNEHLKVYSQIITGRNDFMNCSNGKVSFEVEKYWQEIGLQRKQSLQNIYIEVEKFLGDGKILVACATEAELKTYSKKERELIPHSYCQMENRICFHTEYILLPPDIVDQTVFVYGPEFVANFNLTLFEILRITKSDVILGISFGTGVYGQISCFSSIKNFLDGIQQNPNVNLIDSKQVVITDSFDGRKKDFLIVKLQKQILEKVAKKQEVQA